MSNFQDLNPCSPGQTTNAPNMFVAATTDALATVQAAGYLNDLQTSGIVNPGDILFINYGVGGTPGETGGVATADGTDLNFVVGTPGSSGGAGEVTSVFGRSGAVTAGNGDYTASNITNVPAGGIASITVQAALDELDTNKVSTTLASAKILVGDVANVAKPVSITGDITLSDAGVVAIAAGVIIDADVKSDAAIALSKLAPLGNNFVAQTSATGVLEASAVTSTELSYLGGVTAGIQAQFSSKQAKAVVGGAADTAGTLTLNGATPVVVNTTAVSATPLILFSRKTAAGATLGEISIAAETTGASFSLVSASATDTSTVNWYIVA